MSESRRSTVLSEFEEGRGTGEAGILHSQDSIAANQVQRAERDIESHEPPLLKLHRTRVGRIYLVRIKVA